MNQFLSYYKNFGLPIFLMFKNDTHEFIGRCGFGPIETGEIEIGYVLLGAVLGLQPAIKRTSDNKNTRK